MYIKVFYVMPIPNPVHWGVGQAVVMLGVDIGRGKQNIIQSISCMSGMVGLLNIQAEHGVCLLPLGDLKSVALDYKRFAVSEQALSGEAQHIRSKNRGILPGLFSFNLFLWMLVMKHVTT